MNGKLSERDRRLGMKPMPKYGKKKKKSQKKAVSSPSQKKQWIDYPSYLLGNWWKSKRNLKLRSQNYRCEICGKKATQVHHKHYKTLGREKNADLVAICRQCHETHHECLVQCDRHLRSIENQA